MLKKHRKCRRSTRNGRCPMTTKRRRTRPDPNRNSPQTTTTKAATRNRRFGKFMDPLLEYLLLALRNAPLQATDHHLHIFFFRPHLVSFWNRRRKGISDKLQRTTARTLSPILFNQICSISFSTTSNYFFLLSITHSTFFVHLIKKSRIDLKLLFTSCCPLSSGAGRSSE